jgi:flagellar hook assembly protein FlgD
MRLSLPQQAEVRLRVYDAAGRLVDQREFGQKLAGTWQLTWTGEAQASGLYLFEIIAGTQRVVKKATLLK